MFVVMIFELVLCIFIVNAMNSIKNKLVNLFRISFYKFLKIHNMIKLAMLYFGFFYSSLVMKKKLCDKKSESIWAFKTTLECTFLDCY